MSTQDEVVSQSDIESLLAMVGNEAQASDPAAPVAEEKGPGRKTTVRRFEFPQSSTFSSAELRKLRVKHEEFVSCLSDRLSLYLRMECGLQMLKMETVRFKQYVENLPNPTHLSLIKLEPLKGIAILDFPSRLGLCILDRELGGPAVSLDEGRILSKMDVRLLSRAVEIMAGEWCRVWSEVMDLRAVLLRSESNATFLDTHASDALLLVVGIEVKIGEMIEQMQFTIPYSILEPLMLKLDTNAEKADEPKVVRPAQPLKWNAALDDMSIPMVAELPDVKLTARELSQLLAPRAEKCAQVRIVKRSQVADRFQPPRT